MQIKVLVNDEVAFRFVDHVEQIKHYHKNFIELRYHPILKSRETLLRFVEGVPMIAYATRLQALLIRIGLTRWLDDGKLFVPFHMPPYYKSEGVRGYIYRCRFCGPFYIFRNRPGLIRRIPGRMLPRRWGFGVYGFEFGDRG